MRGLDANDDAVGLQDGHDRIGDLLTHPLLQLRSVRRHSHQARQSTETGNALMWGVVNVDEAVKGQQMVFAHRAERDAGETDHAPGLLVAVQRNRIAQCRAKTLVESREEVQEKVSDPIGRPAQAGPIRVVTEREQKLANGRHRAIPVDRRARPARPARRHRGR